MSKGDRAPFDGLLMNRQLADRIEAEKKTRIDKKECEIQSKASVAICSSNAKQALEIQQARYSALQDKHTQLLQVKQEQIDFLRKNYLPKAWYESSAFLISVGALSGIALTIGAAHIVKTVR